MSLSARNRRKVTCPYIYFFKNIPVGKVKAGEGKPCQLQCRGQANVHLVKCYHKDFDCQVSIFPSWQRHFSDPKLHYTEILSKMPSFVICTVN